MPCGQLKYIFILVPMAERKIVRLIQRLIIGIYGMAGVRNIMIINTFLSESQLINLYRQSIAKFYNWLEFGEYEIIKSINNNSYLGCVYANNTKSLNVLHTLLKGNTQDLSQVIFK